MVWLNVHFICNSNHEMAWDWTIWFPYFMPRIRKLTLKILNISPATNNELIIIMRISRFLRALLKNSMEDWNPFQEIIHLHIFEKKMETSVIEI